MDQIMNELQLRLRALNEVPKTTIFLLGFTAWLAYLIGLAIYRLYFHPLAKFPGPKLAALTKWYEFYYEVVLRGQFTFTFDELHDRYGPIIRITPFELHVKDSSFWDTLYNKPKGDRYDWMNGRFGNDTSVFTTSDHVHHKVRRSALNPMFSKKAVGRFEPFVQQKVNGICHKIAPYHENDRPLAINRVFAAYSGDVATQYSFGFSYNNLQSDDFQETFQEAFIAVSEFGHLALQFPWITPLVNSLPDSWAAAMNPPLEKLLQLQRDLKRIIARIRADRDKTGEILEHPTLFHEILASDLPEEEKSVNRLADEAQTVIGAGLTTTAFALTNAVFYIVEDPKIQAKLRAELREAIPDINAPDAFSWQKLEQLPYLRGCIREGTRFGPALTGRGPRVFSTPLQYREWTIPPRTPVSMCLKDLHWDPTIYPEPDRFIPERWMNDPKAPDGSSLERYYVGFGKGPRQCLGIHLAYMEMFVILGSLFRLFEFELHETDRSDIEIVHDFFLPSPRLDSLGVRLKVKSVDPAFSS